MSTQEITNKIRNIKDNFLQGNLNSEETCELLDDLCCELEEADGLSFGDTSDDYYTSFEETDFTKLEI